MGDIPVREWKPEDPETVRKREDAEATIIVRAQIRKDATLVKVYAEMAYQMADIVTATYGLVTDSQGKRPIFANAPAEFVEAVREVESALSRLKNTSGVYR